MSRRSPAHALCIALLAAAMLALVGPLRAQPTTEEINAFQSAEDAYRSRDWRQAAQAYHDFVIRYPKSALLPQVTLRMGQAYAQLGDESRARQAYSTVIQSNPDDVYASQAVSYWANLYAARYQYREAAVMSQEVMRKFPKSRAAEMAHYLLGTYLYADGRADEAARAYRTFLNTYPSSIYSRSAFRQLISILLQQSKGAEAEQLLDQHLTESPNDVDLIDQLAQVYRRQERYDDAIRLLDRSLRRRPNDSSLLESLGEVYAEKGDHSRALATWKKVIDVNPQAGYSTYQRVGYLLKKYGIYQEAAFYYEEAIKRQPTYNYLYSELADIYRIQGDLDRALGVYARSLLNVGLAYSNRRPVLDAIGELFPDERREEALTRAEDVIRATAGASLGSSPAAILSLAELELMRGRFDEALSWFERLADVHSDNGATLARYAESFARKEQSTQAVRLYQAAVRLFPNATETPQRLTAVGEQLERLGQWEEAAAMYRRAIARDPLRRGAREADRRLVVALLRGLHRPDEALKHLEEVRSLPQLSYQRPQLDLLAAEARVALGEYDEALAAVERLMESDADSESVTVRARYLAGEIRLFRGETDAALEFYKDVAATAPSSDVANDALARMALIRANTGRFRAALDAYVRAIVARDRGDADAAIAACREAIATSADAPVASDAGLLLGELALSAGDTATGVEAYEAVVERGGHLAAEALLRLGTFYRANEEREAAVKAYERLLEQFPQGAFSVEARQSLRALLQQ